MTTVLIAADICPIEGNLPFFLRADADSLFHDLLPEFKQADLVVANLECPLIEAPSPILKTGPTFGAPPACIEAIRAGHIDTLCLANNHILDHGAAGLKSTLEACARAGIHTVGAGENRQAARRILIRQAGSKRIGLLAVAEHEFSIAGRDSWGANPIDLIDFVRNVREHRADFDYLIVLVHGSAEFHAPTPRIRDTCRFMVEMGANAVIVQHPHMLGGHELYQDGHIVYGQGALVMDEALYRPLKSFHQGVVVRLAIPDQGPSTMDLLPFTQSDPVPGARRMPGDQARAFLETLAARSANLANDALVEAQWVEFCEKRRHGYISSFLGHGGILRRLNRKGWLERFLYGPRRLAGARNLVSCETHREALQTLFDRRLV
ncbi:MAG: CapA family protein [Verrucomicrobiae bacterium]|nr:CapA family protein [Verrucomicrobiae bacterium]